MSEDKFVDKLLWGCLAWTLVALFVCIGIFIGHKTVLTSEMTPVEAAASGVDININVN